MPDKLKDDAVFKADCDREPRAHPELRDEFRAAVRELAETGTNEMLSRRRCLIRAAYPATPVTVMPCSRGDARRHRIIAITSIKVLIFQ